MTYKVGYIVGSIASTSINRKLAEQLVAAAPENLELVELPIKDLPFYSSDNDANIPAEAAAFKQAIESVDAVLVITPEYNRSIPGVLKNALDTASRPWGQNSFTGKPGAIIGASIGAIGTAVAQSNLRTVLGFLDVVLMGQPEAYIAWTPENFNEDGTPASEKTREVLTNYMAAFAAHIERVAK